MNFDYERVNPTENPKYEAKSEAAGFFVTEEAQTLKRLYKLRSLLSVLFNFNSEDGRAIRTVVKI